MKKYLSTLFVAGALLSACSGDSTYETAPESQDAAAIALRSTSPDATTRAAFEGAISSSNPLETRVIASKDNTFGDIHANGKMIFKASNTNTLYEPGTVTLDEAKYPTGVSRLYFWGLSPYIAQPVGSSYLYTVTGNKDVMASTVVQAVEAGGTWGIPELKFKHLLTKLTIGVKADQDALDDDVFGTIQSITLCDAYGNASAALNTVSVSLSGSNPTVTTPATGTGEIDFYTIESGKYTDTPFAGMDVALTTTTTACAYTMVPPLSKAVSGVESYYMLVHTSKFATPYLVGVKLYDKNGDPFEGPTSGYAFSVTLNFIGEDVENLYIEAKAVSVENWADGGDFNTPIYPAQ